LNVCRGLGEKTDGRGTTGCVRTRPSTTTTPLIQDWCGGT
jgi:hypothetical protein